MRSRLLALCVGLVLLGWSGCDGPTQSSNSPQAADLRNLESRMTSLFSALEMYAHDHSLNYPDDLMALSPKYVEAIPIDPASGQAITYKKTERGYLLEVSGDYSSSGAAPGYPKMDQDGFFAVKPTDFPKEGEL